MPLLLPNVIENDTPADAAEVQQNYGVTQQYVNANLIERYGSVAMQAPLTLFGAPTADMHAATKAYVDAMLPVGVMLPYGGTAAPAGQWALCNGAALATASYPELFSALGYRFGGSGGSFNLPNTAGRVPIGVTTERAAFNATGKTGGSFDVVNVAHTHTINHDHGAATSGSNSVAHQHYMPAHSHTMTHDHPSATTSAAGGHSHAMSANTIGQLGTGNLGLQAGGTGRPMNTGVGVNAVGDHTHTLNVPSYSGNTGNVAGNLGTSTETANHTHSVNLPAFNGASGSQGTANAEQIPPYLIVNYIIRLD